MNETQRRLRGHDFLPEWAALKAAIPLLYETEDVPLTDKVIHLHFFAGGCDWYIAELDDDSWNAFGYANLNDPRNAEWGYVSLLELEAVRVGPSVVERDLLWMPQPFSQVT